MSVKRADLNSRFLSDLKDQLLHPDLIAGGVLNAIMTHKMTGFAARKSELGLVEIQNSQLR